MPDATPSVEVEMSCIAFAVLSGFAAAQGCTLEDVLSAIFTEESNRIKDEQPAD